MSQFNTLFSEGRIGSLRTRNRLVMAPMVLNYADEGGRVTRKYAAHIARVASGGVGMMVLEASYIRDDGKGFSNELGIQTDEVIPGLRELADIAHEHGAVIGPQLYHAGRQTSSAVTGLQPVAPSAVPDPTIGEIPRALSRDEIRDMVQAYADAARRAKDAGCDFVEIHGAHGYLITQFLSAFSNKRDDEYGGSLENRMRFMVEVVNAVMDEVGPDFPVTLRLSGAEMVPGGITPDDTVRFAKRLEELGVDAVHISAGNYASYELGYMIQPMAIPDGPLVPLAERVKEAVNIPVITVGKLRDPQFDEDTLNSGKADFIAQGRTYLADPDWPNKAREGRLDEINKCIACNQGCISRLFDNLDVWCTVNPETAREIEFAEAQPDTAFRVLLAGGGPAGMEAAKVAAEKGHTVILCEKKDHLGGQLIAAAAAPYRPGWEELRQYLMHEMDRLGIDVRLETEATADLARQENIDIGIVAVGSHTFRPDIPGMNGPNVLAARDVLEGAVTAKGRVVVAGGGCAGAQTAEFLADKGHEVTLVEMMGAIAIDAPRAERELLLGRLQERGVQILIDTKILSVEEDSVGVQKPHGIEYLPADTVVVCLGSVSNDGLLERLRDAVSGVFVVGDALDPRKVTEAIAEGAVAALSISQPGMMEVRRVA